MSRVTRLSRSQVTPEVRSLYEEIGAQRGNVPNMFRVYAHRPEILKTMMAHLAAVTNTGTVPVRTKELVATLVSRINECHYCNASHTTQASRHGATGDQMEKLLDYEKGPFSEAEKSALAYARALTLESNAVTEELMTRLRGSYSEGEIVEISAMAGLFNYFNRVNNALQMQPTKQGEGLEE